MDSPEVNTNSALLLRTGLGRSITTSQASATTSKWLNLAQDSNLNSSKDAVDIRTKLKGEVLGHLRDFLEEINDTDWMFSTQFNDS
mmetsp:Transcript_50191/g.99180  ORF Transcript_50191/g.99180 Transcript_50191/m.99180 type:complete len:86 (+) Transcript_50191:75-332(+)